MSSTSSSRRDSYSDASWPGLSTLSISSQLSPVTSPPTPLTFESPVASSSVHSDYQFEPVIVESQDPTPKRTRSTSSKSTSTTRGRATSPTTPKSAKKSKADKSVKEKCRRRILTRQIITMLDDLEADGLRFNKKDRLSSANHKTSKGLKQTKIVTIAQHTVVSREKGRRLNCLLSHLKQIELARSLIKTNQDRAIETLVRVESSLTLLATAPFVVSDADIEACIGLTTEELAGIDASSMNKD
jgi:hypothetical protein